MVKISSRIWYVEVKWMLKPRRIRNRWGFVPIARLFATYTYIWHYALAGRLLLPFKKI